MDQRIQQRDEQRRYQVLRQSWPELEPYRCPGDVLHFLGGQDGDPGQKNAVLYRLVWLVQSGGGDPVAEPMLWLALWPGLQRARSRLLRLSYASDDVDGALQFHVNRQFRELDISYSRPIAKSVIDAVYRDAKDVLARESRSGQPFDERDHVSPADESEDSELGLSALLGLDQSIDAIRKRLVRVLSPEDAEFVIAVAIHERHQRDESHRLGLTYEQGRKRYQRAMQTLKKHWPKLCVPNPGE